ncbi:hypothetical protein QFZ56_007757 [Streptomyces achromogenes]|uniref:Uncharacterized protein n=1 Tax=Streptomyces achromogenes TaxID=67255 RepID=A0ABU0QDR1_STRAH|nr:hypothetical protein [Streptomyces achromogenes]MDQ0688794.1 hypothetical protein [Streptomyces achromogenes]
MHRITTAPVAPIPARTCWAVAAGAGAALAAAWWLGDTAPYPYAQRGLLDVPLPFRGRSGERSGASSGGLLGGAGMGGAVGGRLEHARQVDVEVLDFNLAAPVAQCAGKDFGEAACTFPHYGCV